MPFTEFELQTVRIHLDRNSITWYRVKPHVALNLIAAHEKLDVPLNSDQFSIAKNAILRQGKFTERDIEYIFVS